LKLGVKRVLKPVEKRAEKGAGQITLAGTGTAPEFIHHCGFHFSVSPTGPNSGEPASARFSC
jgi:hypothetical protein